MRVFKMYFISLKAKAKPMPNHYRLREYNSDVGTSFYQLILVFYNLNS